MSDRCSVVLKPSFIGEIIIPVNIIYCLCEVNSAFKN